MSFLISIRLKFFLGGGYFCADQIAVKEAIEKCRFVFIPVALYFLYPVILQAASLYFDLRTSLWVFLYFLSVLNL